MNRRYILASLAAWFVIWTVDGILHGMILKPFYMETSEFWRSQAEMEEKFPWVIVGEGIFAFLFTFVFTKGYENRGIGEGARYGWWIGLLLATLNLIFYAVQPLPAKIFLAWSVGDLVKLTLAGVVVAAIYRPTRHAL